MSVQSLKERSVFLMTMNSTHLENSKNLKSDNQLILLKAYKRKTARQEKWMFFEKAYDKNKHKKRIESLSDYNDKSDVYIDTESDIVKTLSAQELHKCLLVALDELTDFERLIIDEVFFSPDKRPSLEELGNKHNISRQAYSRKLNRTLHKLRILIEQDITEY